MSDREPIHVTVPGSPDDPRALRDRPEGVIVHHVPELHPDDVCMVDGLRTTSPSRTLIDLAEVMDVTGLRECLRTQVTLGSSISANLLRHAPGSNGDRRW